MADEVIRLVAAAQQSDGYLNSYYQVVEPDHHWGDLDHGHELYCAGHLMQAAIAFQRATGDTRLLDVARRLADHIDTVFGPDKRQGACGHPEVEMALVELYRCTQDRRYLRLAQFFIDQRGQRKMRGFRANGPEYHQDHVPVREVQAAAGHAVRQMYLAAGVSDVCLETGEPALAEAMQRLWHDIASTKLYITGGVGARFDGEAFGEPYELPSDQCYCETCAAIGSLMWNWRLLLLTGESRHADLIERTLYNGILSSPSLDGEHYFYVNPLMMRNSGQMRMSSTPLDSRVFSVRPEWHYVACCPPNVMRLFASLGHYLATYDHNGIQIHQYTNADIAAELGAGGNVALKMTTDYPWNGAIRLTITETNARRLDIALAHPRLVQKLPPHHRWGADRTARGAGRLPRPDPRVARGYDCRPRSSDGAGAHRSQPAHRCRPRLPGHPARPARVLPGKSRPAGRRQSPRPPHRSGSAAARRLELDLVRWDDDHSRRRICAGPRYVGGSAVSHLRGQSRPCLDIRSH